MESYRDQAAKLVDAVGNLGTAAGYGKYAEAQRVAADRWRWATVALVLAAVGFSIWSLDVFTQAAAWQRVAGRLAVVGLLGGLAAYLGRQSGQHRQREAAARKVELELAAIDPYLALLDDETRTEVKKIAERLFGQPLAASGELDGEAPLPARQAMRLIKDVVRTLGR